MFKRQGALVVTSVIIFMLFYIQQGILAPRVSPVFVENPNGDKHYCELSGNLFVCSQHQIVEAQSVTELLCYISDEGARRALLDYFLGQTLKNGQSVCLDRDSNGFILIMCGFMSAQKRITLGVALHPDRMTTKDWKSLPGVGDSMARAITDNKIKYGDFCTYEALGRVRGVGVKTLDRWRIYF